MYFKKILLAVLTLTTTTNSHPTLERRRFGQEQAIFQLINTFKFNGKPGCENGSVGGPAISTLLAAADPCAIMAVAQKVLDCGGAVNDARQVLTLEKNFNPFVVQAASVCTDPSLPSDDQLRGILPKVDPSLPGAAEYEAKRKQRDDGIINGSIDGASLAQGKSVADQMVELGFTAVQGAKGEKANPDNKKQQQQQQQQQENVSGNGVQTALDKLNSDVQDLSTLIPAGSNESSNLSKLQTDVQALDSFIKSNNLATSTSSDSTNSSPSPEATAAASVQAADGGNLQPFTGAVGGVKAPAITNDGSQRPFHVDGNANFDNLKSAIQRSCDVQNNKCFDLINLKRPGSEGLSTSDCQQQQQQCNAGANNVQQQQADGNPKTNGNDAKAGKNAGSSCIAPTILFGPGFDGRKEDSFIPSDKSHGSAQNIKIITNFLCDVLSRQKDDACNQKCENAAKAADSATKGQPQADAFNAAFGNQSPAPQQQNAKDAGSSCTAPTILFGPGFDGRKEDSFIPSDKSHGSALNIGVISSFICTTLARQNDDACNKKCQDAAQAAASATKGQPQADAFNAAFGNQSPAPQQQNAKDAGSSCTAPKILFGPGFDGRKEDSFIPSDKSHGSALNIGVISSFICTTLARQNDDACNQKCQDAAQAAASATKGQPQADAFNAAFGN